MDSLGLHPRGLLHPLGRPAGRSRQSHLELVLQERLDDAPGHGRFASARSARKHHHLSVHGAHNGVSLERIIGDLQLGLDLGNLSLQPLGLGH